jgi:hypothetical protein
MDKELCVALPVQNNLKQDAFLTLVSDLHIRIQNGLGPKHKETTTEC